jgi:amino acid adenylation domain-containing protein
VSIGAVAGAEAEAETIWTLADTEQSVPRRFAERARDRRGEPAIAGTAWQPSYEELHGAAAAIAADLRERNADGSRIALLLGHDAPLIAAMLGALHAGCAIVVLNPRDPPGRLDRIRRQVRPRLALVDRRHRELASRAGFERAVELPDPPGDAAIGPGDPRIEPGDLAAVMYTSGSTGQPKGVVHTHHTLLHTALRHARGLGLRPGDRVALLASPSGGHGMGTTWTTLLSGATLCPFPVMDRGIAELPGWLRANRITVLGLSASLFRRLIGILDGTTLPELRLVRLGSEQVHRSDLEACRERLGERCTFANVYSLTEAGGLAHCLFGRGEASPPGPLPAGRAAAGIEITLLGEHGDPARPGEVGEIVVRSAHLSPGYWRHTGSTAQPNLDAPAGERVLRTGDLGRLDDRGRLLVVGRRDEQVKIRGFRVELTEVEAALRALPQVEAAAARAEPTRHGDPRLTAYVVTAPGPVPVQAELRQALRATLAEASVPTAFAFVDDLPLNAHGKLDQDRLARLAVPASADRAAAAEPAGDLERMLSGIWAEALELERVGRDEDFFDLGGDSLTAAEIGAALHDSLGVELDMRSFARHPTVAGMAALVGRLRGGRTGEPRLVPVPRNGPLPCSFAQERIWRFALGSTSYTVSSIAALQGDVDLEAMRAALDHVVARHEPLRTTFTERDGMPLQVIRTMQPLEVPLTDVSVAPDPEQRSRELLREMAAQAFDLERGPLLRLRLARLGEGDHHLLRVSHHLVSDRRSWQIFYRELAAAYAAIRRGESFPRTGDALQYADFAAWQRRMLRPDGRRYGEQLAWWRQALAPVPPRLELPFSRATPASGLRPRDGVLLWGIHPSVVGALDRLGREDGATRYTVRLALFSALLALETGQEAITLGAYVDTRRVRETRSMFGYFSNLVTLVLPFDPRATLRGWIAKAGFILAETAARSDLPYQLVCEELRAVGRIPPEIRAIFAVRQPMPELPFGTAEWVPPSPSSLAMPWGFSFTIDQGDESDRCQTTFDAHLHDPAAVRRFIDRYAALAEAAADDPDRPLGELHAALR